MGDRATIRIKHSESDTAIHLYTHWRGSEVNTIVADALQRATEEGRITDDAYCTRIIFDTLTQLEGGSTGYGILIGDDQRPGDVAHDSPSIVWTEWNREPTVGFHTLDGHITEHAPWQEWVTESTLHNFLSHDLTDG